MLPILRSLEAAGDTHAKQVQLGALLGLDEAVPVEVLTRAHADDRYATYLLRSRGHPELLTMLFGKAAESQPTSQAAPQVELSNSELLRKAGSAALKWAASGFKRIEPDVLERRNAACHACPYLKAAPDRILYKVTLSAQSDQRVCGACGCTASRKASLPDESCPMEHPEHPGFTRWHEPIRRADESVRG
ncbi:hypothetical protein ACWIGM_10390 [Bosea sp. NPDC055332]